MSNVYSTPTNNRQQLLDRLCNLTTALQKLELDKKAELQGYAEAIKDVKEKIKLTIEELQESTPNLFDT